MSSKFLRPLRQGPTGPTGPQGDTGATGPPGPLDPTLVVGPATATDNAVARFDETTGKLVQNSLVTVSDTGELSAASVRTGTLVAPTQTVGLLVADTAAADISFTGSAYADAGKIGWVLQLADATGRLSLHNAGGGGGGGGSRDYDVVPSTFANAGLPANSYDYYINERTTHAMTIDAVRLIYSTTGSDSTRVAIYRGTDTTAVLVGQSGTYSVYSSPWMVIPIAAVAGQNLDFSHDEPLVLAIALSGTTTSLKSVTATSDTSRHWFNNVDSVAGGFPTNPRGKLGSMTSVPCCRLIAA